MTRKTIIRTYSLPLEIAVWLKEESAKTRRPMSTILVIALEIYKASQEKHRNLKAAQS